MAQKHKWPKHGAGQCERDGCLRVRARGNGRWWFRTGAERLSGTTGPCTGTDNPKAEEAPRHGRHDWSAGSVAGWRPCLYPGCPWEKKARRYRVHLKGRNDMLGVTKPPPCRGTS